MFSPAFISLALAASALANVFITSPISTTSLTAGQQSTITWIDSGNPPSLAEFGLATFAVYAGNSIEQTLLQEIATGVNVSALSSLAFTPDGTIGPNSDEYFIRVTSETYKDPATPQYYEEAFSSLFTLGGMTGTFNSTVQAEIDGQSTAPIGGATASSQSTQTTSTVSMMTSMVMTTSSTSTTASTTPSSSSSSSSHSSSSSSAPSASSSSTSGASKPIMASGIVALVATLIGATLL